MRQLIVRGPRGCGSQVLERAQALSGTHLACVEATADGRLVDLVLVHLSNGDVEPFLGELEQMHDLHITLLPAGVVTMQPPPSEAPDQVLDVSLRSPVEIFLDGLQSVGSWKGFLGYAMAAGFVVWIGLYTNTIYLLVAAMLIAPYAGPAMIAALATARGDASLLGRSFLRYAAALVASIAVAFVMSLVMRQEIATEQMISASLVTSVAVVLPLVAGAAGALNLAQSERSSLVSGAATGILVAASLAPPAGLVGMAAAIGEWEMVLAGLFVLLLQIVGINIAGAVVFRLVGLTSRGVRYARGRSWVGTAAFTGSVLALAVLLAWQFSSPPELQHPTQAQRAAALIQDLVRGSGLALPVETDARFTRARSGGQDILLVVLYVESTHPGATEFVRQRLEHDIRTRLDRTFNAVTLVDLRVLHR